MKKIVFIGAAGSGKSTLSGKVFVKLKESQKIVDMVPEWVRYEIMQNGPMRSIWEQYRTRATQKELEDAIPTEVEVAVIDSGTLTPYFYACLYADHADARQRLVLRDMFRYLMDDLYLRRYDHIFYLAPIPNANLKDGTRYQTEDELATLDQHMDLLFNKVFKTGNVHRIDGPVEKRLDKVMKIIGEN